jgi:hypothetical protein
MKNPEHFPKNPVETPKNSLENLKEQVAGTPRDIARIEAISALRDQQLVLVEKVKMNKGLPRKNDLQKLEARLIA